MNTAALLQRLAKRYQAAKAASDGSQAGISAYIREVSHAAQAA